MKYLCMNIKTRIDACQQYVSACGPYFCWFVVVGCVTLYTLVYVRLLSFVDKRRNSSKKNFATLNA
jgi:hypothetical protein